MFVVGFHAPETEFGNEPLRPFLNPDEDCNVALLPLVVVDLHSSHFNIAKAVGTVQLTNGVEVALQAVFSETPVTVTNKLGRHYRHPLPNGVFIEIVIALNGQFDDLV